MTSKRERLAAALAGEISDRLPVALWRHFPVDDQNAESFAESTLSFQRLFDFDFVKVTPASSYALVDLGVEDAWQGSAEGTRTYTRRVVQHAEDWPSLRRLSPKDGSLARYLDALRRVVIGIGEEAPVLATIFSPLAQAKNAAGGDRLIEDLRHSPRLLEAGLRTLTDSTVDLVSAARSAGVDGIFYAVQHASPRFMDRDTYRRVAEPLDREILGAAEGLFLNVLHLHGADIYFDLAQSYPVGLVNWHDRETAPSLAEARLQTTRALCGGIGLIDSLVLGRPDQIYAQAADARRMTGGGRGLVLGTGCVVPLTAPTGNLRAVRAAADLA
jgi:uroporphyrinogen decarboxylase